MPFEPIAIIGQACLFPGAFSPAELWQLSLEKKDSFSNIAPQRVKNVDLPQKKGLGINQPLDIRGGYITGFEKIFNPNGFAIPVEEITTLGTVFQWPLHLAREALKNAGYDYRDLSNKITGTIFANLSYPNHALKDLTLQVWLEQQEPELKNLFSYKKDWRNRFMSGLPAQLVAQACQFSGVAYTLDAACGSVIYALKLACNELQNHRADIMLAGGINAVDETFSTMAFTIMQALSKSGQSRPFDRNADGLLLSEGGGMFVLKRLRDAINEQDQILAVIRGIGLSNDGHSSGLLVPTVAGQVLAMKKAYQIAEIDPKTISYIECHATGTPVGDGVEIRSMQQIFPDNKNLVLGALKANIGHALAASAAAALVRVICAMQENVLPPIKSLENPIKELQEMKATVLQEPAVWQRDGQCLRAGVNGFGMGGANAHLIIEQYQPEIHSVIIKKTPVENNPDEASIAVIALNTLVGDSDGHEDLAQHLFCGQSLLKETNNTLQSRIDTIQLPIRSLRFPPNDLRETTGQQLAILHAGLAIREEVKQPYFGDARTGIYIGMGCDPDVARRTIRWVLQGLLEEKGIQVSEQWLRQALDSIDTPCKPAHVLGAMPNIIASRLAVQWDCKGPCFAVCSEELSGVTALQIAIDALQAKEIDMAVVGAVDLSCELVHQQAVKALLPEIKQTPGDAAVVLILKRIKDARADNEEIIAVFNNVNQSQSVSYKIDETHFIPLFGHAHAASGLLHVVLAALACRNRLLPAMPGKNFPIPWVPLKESLTAQVDVSALGGQNASIFLTADEKTSYKPFILHSVPQLYCFSGNNRREVIQALQNRAYSQQGSARLVIIAGNEEKLQQKQELALHLLESAKENPSLPHHGIYFRERALTGKIAFVFASSSTSYLNMGLDVALAFPELLEQIHQRYPQVQKVLNLLYGSSTLTSNFSQESVVTGFLSCLHYLLGRNILGIKPEVVMGHSLGESDALTAIGAFNDLVAMEAYVDKTELFTQLLDGEYRALQQYYPQLEKEKIAWENWNIHADVEQVKLALSEETYCHLTIINSSHDCVIAGLPQACQRIINQVKPLASKKLRINAMVHCPEVSAIADTFYQLHHRPITPQEVSIYSCITGKSYPLTSKAVAENMLSVGTGVVNFPMLIQNAWDDGVRIFIEQGPQGLCSHWIKEILGDKDFVATHFDQMNRSGLLQAMHVIAELITAGVDINYQKFSQRVHHHE